MATATSAAGSDASAVSADGADVAGAGIFTAIHDRQPSDMSGEVVGALRHALAFSTWRSLAGNGVRRSDAVKLSTALVEAAAAR